MDIELLPGQPRDEATLTDAFGWADIPGALGGVAQAGIKSTGRDDLIVLLARGATAAVTTRSTAAAAPCIWSRARVPSHTQAVVINAGNANASTGLRGMEDTRHMASEVARHIGCTVDEVLVCSTGVIGVPLPMDRVTQGIAEACRSWGASSDRLARAILTTDLVPKTAAAIGAGARIAGFAKGSGMIHPDMATMLAFLVTNAQIEANALQGLLEDITACTFNAVTVDGDMSTNDTVIMQSTGEGPSIVAGTPEWDAFKHAVTAVCRDLSRAIARDGEGAEHLITVEIAGLETDEAAREAARAVCRSPLVKTAIAGRDANWGRIVGALGAVFVPGLDCMDLDVAGIPVLRNGTPLAFDEESASNALAADEVVIRIRLPGSGWGEAWGCDFTEGYIRINADYRS